MQKARGRVDFHVKMKPKLRELFKQTCQQKGFSTCFVIETLIQAWVAAAPRISEAHPSSTITITQKIDYVVERPRRVKGFRTPLENCYMNGCWTYRKPEGGEELTKLKHVIECHCSVCQPYKPKWERTPKK